MKNFDLILLMAQPQGDAAPNAWASLIPWLMIFVVIYFFMIRPQSKKAKEQKAFRDSLTKGSKVVTVSGVHGKITDLDDTTVMLEIDNNVRIKMERSSISPEFTNAAYGPKPEKK